jgi:hypothetical protein
MRRIAISVVAALLALSALAPVAAADDPEPAIVGPCIDGLTWYAEPGQPLGFWCGWGGQTYGSMRSFLTANVRSFTVTDASGAVVIDLDPTEAAAVWRKPMRLEAEPGEVTCASRWGWLMQWRYPAEGLEAGVYTMTWTETLTHPVNDQYHTCWFADGTRLVPPPSLYSGPSNAVSTLVVE